MYLYLCKRCCPCLRWCIQAHRCSGWSPVLWCNVMDGRLGRWWQQGGRRRPQWLRRWQQMCLSWWQRLKEEDREKGKQIKVVGHILFSAVIHTHTDTFYCSRSNILIVGGGIFDFSWGKTKNRDQSTGFFRIIWELMLDLSNATIASVSSVMPTCWQRALTGVSRPASGTDTGELVHFIHTCPTIQAWSGCTLIDVWVKSTERRVEQMICIMPNYIWASFNAYEERMWNIFVWDKVEDQPKTQSRDKGQYYILLYWRRQSLKKKHNRNRKKIQNLPHSDTHRNTLVLCTLLEEDWEHWLTTIQRGRREFPNDSQGVSAIDGEQESEQERQCQQGDGVEVSLRPGNRPLPLHAVSWPLHTRLSWQVLLSDPTTS